MVVTQQELFNEGFIYVHPAYYKMELIEQGATIFFNRESGYLLINSKSDNNNFEYQTTVETKEELTKCLYAFLKRDLDWTQKRFLWDDCFRGGGYKAKKNGGVKSVFQDLDECNDISTFLEEEEAIASVANAQLSHIIPVINSKFPKKTNKDKQYKGFTPCWCDATDRFEVKPVNCLQIIKIHTASEQGCEVLIEHNSRLILELYQLD